MSRTVEELFDTEGERKAYKEGYEAEEKAWRGRNRYQPGPIELPYFPPDKELSETERNAWDLGRMRARDAIRRSEER